MDHDAKSPLYKFKRAQGFQFGIPGLICPAPCTTWHEISSTSQYIIYSYIYTYIKKNNIYIYIWLYVFVYINDGRKKKKNIFIFSFQKNHESIWNPYGIQMTPNESHWFWKKYFHSNFTGQSWWTLRGNGCNLLSPYFFWLMPGMISF